MVSQVQLRLLACKSTSKIDDGHVSVSVMRKKHDSSYPGQASLREPVTGKRVSVFLHSSDHRPVRKY